MTPKVVGFVPAYNSERFILATLEALANQTYSNFEIIIGDDASTDRTAEMCEDFCLKDSRFTLQKNSKNLGWFKTSELLWLESAKRGKYCFTNPHDDLPYPTYISDLVDLMEENEDASIAIPGMENDYWDNSTVISFFTEASGLKNPVERTYRIAKKDVDYWWAAYHGLHRSEWVSKIYPIKKLPFGEREFSLDLISILKMGFYGTLITSDKILLKKVYGKNSVSSKWMHNSKNKAALWIRLLNEIDFSPLSTSEKRELKSRLYLLLTSRIKNRILSLFK